MHSPCLRKLTQMKFLICNLINTPLTSLISDGSGPQRGLRLFFWLIIVRVGAEGRREEGGGEEAVETEDHSKVPSINDVRTRRRAQKQTIVLIGCLSVTVIRDVGVAQNPENFFDVIFEWSLSSVLIRSYMQWRNQDSGYVRLPHPPFLPLPLKD